MKTIKHLTQEERYTIERMRKEGYKQARIAECPGRDPESSAQELVRLAEKHTGHSKGWKWNREELYER